MRQLLLWCLEVGASLDGGTIKRVAKGRNICGGLAPVHILETFKLPRNDRIPQAVTP